MEVNGVLLRRWNNYLNDGVRPEMEMFLSANDVISTNADKVSPHQRRPTHNFVARPTVQTAAFCIRWIENRSFCQCAF